MAISAWSNVLGIEHCGICGHKPSASEATIASAHADGRPAISCNRHRNDRASWVTYWADFQHQQEQLPDASAKSLARLYIESRKVETLTDMKIDLSLHLFCRSMTGHSVIIADRPIEFLSVLRKQWKKITTLLHIERARTLDTWKRYAMQEALDRSLATSFSGTTKHLDAKVIVVSPHNVHLLTAHYSTLYICADLSEQHKLTLVQSLMPGSLLVDYVDAYKQWQSLS